MPAVLLNANELIEESHTEEPELKHPELAGEADESTHAAAFMVLITKDGHYVFEPDINAPVIPERNPTPSEIKGSLSTILMDIQSQETAIMTANATVQAQMQLTRQIQEHQQNAQMLQGLRLR